MTAICRLVNIQYNLQSIFHGNSLIICKRCITVSVFFKIYLNFDTGFQDGAVTCEPKYYKNNSIQDGSSIHDIYLWVCFLSAKHRYIFGAALQCLKNKKLIALVWSVFISEMPSSATSSKRNNHYMAQLPRTAEVIYAERSFKKRSTNKNLPYAHSCMYIRFAETCVAFVYRESRQVCLHG